MAHFDELMQRALTVRNNVAPSSNTAILVGGVLVSIVSALQLLLDTKQGTLTFDDEPTDDSTNPVTSDGIYEAIADAIASIDLSACEKIVNKVTALSAQSTDTQYPSAKCVYDALQAIDLSACEKIINKVTAIDEQSTDVQYPTAKLLYDSLQIVDAYLNNLDARVTSLENDPPVTYIIRGTSSNTGGTETFRISFIAKGAAQPAGYQNYTVDVDNNGVWQIKYVNKYLYGLRRFAYQNTTLLSVDFSDADDCEQLTSLEESFYYCSNLFKVDFHGKLLTSVTSLMGAFQQCRTLSNIDISSAIFSSATTAQYMFIYCVNLLTIDLSSASFASLKNALAMFKNCEILETISWGNVLNFNALEYAGQQGENRGMFQNCFALKNAALSIFATQQFPSLIDITRFFSGCNTLTNIDLHSATFENVAVATYSFSGCDALQNVDLRAATFNSLTTAGSIFRQSAAIQIIDLRAASFAQLQSANQVFNGCLSLGAIDLSSATFENVTSMNSAFTSCNNLTNITLTKVNCAILPTSTANIDLHYSPLTYASMLAVANWLSDLTGYSAHTVTFNTTAWNALTAAEQSNIDAVLQAKNWTRVLSN